MNMRVDLRWFAVLLTISTSFLAAEELGDEGFLDLGGVKLHYVTKGEGTLLVMIHGFPDFWYSWREQMPALSKHFKVVAIDQRGYNKSDQPQGVEKLRDGQAGRGCPLGSEAFQPGESGHRGPRLGRYCRMDVRDEISREDRPPDHSQSSSSEGADTGTGQQSRTTEKQPVRP